MHDEGERVAKENGMFGYYEISVMKNLYLHESLQLLARTSLHFEDIQKEAAIQSQADATCNCLII